MQYVGIQTQKSRNNFRSLLLLLLFPCLVVGLVYLFCYLLTAFSVESEYGNTQELVINLFIQIIPYVIGGVLIWFLIAYFTNTSIINSATGAQTLE
ncbi:MAG: protease, partial [Bacteroidaceae bacterium]